MPRKIWMKIQIGIVLAMVVCPQMVLALPGDLDGSGRVDGYDLISFGLANGSSSGDTNWNPQADMDGNGTIDSADLTMLSTHFGRIGVSFGLWALDSVYTSSQSVYKISDKGNTLWSKSGYYYPNYVAANIADGTAWISETQYSQLRKLEGVDGTPLVTVHGIYCQSASVDYKDGSIWVADSSASKVVKLLPGIPDGYNVSTDTGYHIAISGFSQPQGISVDPEHNVVWVANTYNNQVVRLDANVVDGYNIGTDSGSHGIVNNSGAAANFNQPMSISANYSDGTVWIASVGNAKVFKYNAAGNVKLLEISGFSNPKCVLVNPTDSTAWVADYTYSGRVVHYYKDGSLLSQYTGIPYPVYLAVNPLDGTCWTTSSTEPKLRQLSPHGTVLGTIAGLGNINSLALVPDETMSRYPTAQASLEAFSVDLNETVTFTGTGTDSDGQIVKYEWDFEGDGIYDFSSAETGVTTHAYTVPGVYTPVFRVTDNEFLTSVDHSLILRAGSLTAIASASVVTGTAPLAVVFTGSFIDPVDGKVDSYQWDFDGDAVFEYFSTESANKAYSYTEAGVYQATLKVTDGVAIDTDTIQITVNPASPQASATATPSSGIRPLVVGLSGTATDQDGTIVYYEWDIDGDGTYDWSSTVNGQTSISYTDAGTYVPVFRATDNDGLKDTAEVTIHVSLDPPTAVITSSVEAAHAPQTVTFGAGGSTDLDGSIVTYEWNFGDDISILFFDDMESNNGNWTAEAPWSLGSTDAHSGSRCWSTGHDGNYPNNTNAGLSFGPLDLGDAITATLSFYHRGNVPESYDHSTVYVSPDGGATWGNIWSIGYFMQTEWTQLNLDLSSYAGNDNVIIKFVLTSDSSYTGTGWWIDDVRVTARGTQWVTSTGPTISHEYTTPGDYTTRLRVTDNDGNQDLAAYGIIIQPDNQPVANLTADVISGTAGMTVNFTGSGEALDGTITSYEWNFGEEWVWVADKNNLDIVRLAAASPEEKARMEGFYYPLGVAVDPATGRVWVADTNNDNVVLLRADGRGELLRISGFYNPVWVDVDPADGSVWIADDSRDKVYKYSDQGEKLVEYGGLYDPQCLAVNTVDGSVWIADKNNNRVLMLNSAGVLQKTINNFMGPLGIAVNPNDGTIWVSNSGAGTVIRMDASVPDGYVIGSDTGKHTVITGFNNPYEIDVNTSDNTVWVANYGANQVVHLSADGGTKTAEIGGFSNPYNLAVNSVTGQVWVSSNGQNEVVLLDEDGSEVRRYSGFSSPRDVDAVEVSGNRQTTVEGGVISHQYNSPGTYYASLTVTDSGGKTFTDYVTITVRGLPTVTASSSVSGGSAPLEVFLSAESRGLASPIVKYQWDFDGDGSYDFTSTMDSAIRHVYPVSGTYNATILITDADGKTATDSVTITVAQATPQALAQATPRQGDAPLTVSFSGAGTDADGQIVNYKWDFTSDGSYDYSSADTVKTSHTYTAEGEYTATLQVTDNNGLTGTDTVTVSVYANGTPMAMLDVTPTREYAPVDVCFFLHGKDFDGTLNSYSVDYDGDGSSDASFASSPTVFGDNAEKDGSLWTATGTWAQTAKESHSGSFSWTDSPDGDYAPSTDTVIDSVTIDLSSAVAPKLIYWEKYALSGGDNVYVYVSGNDGGSWTQIAYWTGARTLSSWTRRELDLSGYAGNATVKIRFRLYTDTGTVADGWYLDDIFVGDCVSHTYNFPGAYQPTFTVTDNSGKTSADKQAVAALSTVDDTYIWVADTYNHAVKKYNQEGVLLVATTGYSYPYDVEVDPTTGNVWVSDKNNDRLIWLDAGVFNGYNVSVPYAADALDSTRYGALHGSSVITTTGKFNNGLNTGAGGYVRIASDPAFDVQSFTYEAWIKPTALYVGLFARNNSSGGDELLVWGQDADTIRVYLDTSNYNFDGSANLLDGNFHHVAVVHDAGADTLTCYVDGAQYGSQVSVNKTLNFAESDILIGAEFNGYNASIGYPFKGMMDDVRFWNVARTGAEINTYKDTELSGAEPGLISYWKMENTNSPFHKVVAGVDECLRIGVDPKDGSVWAADKNHHRAVKFDTDGVQQAEVIGLYSPEGVDVDPVNRTLWIADNYNDRVISMTADFSGTCIGGATGVVNDSTANGNNAMLMGDAALKPGYFSESMYFDGDRDYLVVMPDPAMDVQDFTVEAWIWSNDFSDNGVFMRGNGSGYNEIYIGFDNSSYVRVYVNNISRGFSGGFSLQDGAFHHLAVVYDSAASTVTCYVDGQLYGTPATGVTGPLDFQQSQLLIGADFDSFNGSLGNYWAGRIDDVRLWNVARTQTEIADNKDLALAGNENGLVGYWKMDGLNSPLGTVIYTGIDDPVDVCAYSADGGAWAAAWSGDQVVKCQPGGGTVRYMGGVDGPVSVAVDQANGKAWVASYYQYQMVLMSPDYSELERVSGFYYPYDVEIDPQDGTAWVADMSNSSVVRLAPNGTELRRITGLSSPRGLSIDTVSKKAGNPPQVTASATPLTGDALLEVSFSGSATSGGSIALYEWDFDNDGVYDYSSTSIAATTYTYTSPGYYSPVLKVTDNNGMTGYNASVSVQVGPPRVVCTASPASGAAPVTIKLNALVHGLGLNISPVLYEWDVNSDGVYESSSATNPYFSYRYQTGADWVATCRVTDSNGDQHFGSVQMNVAKTPPTASNGATPTSGNAPLTVFLDGYGSDNDGSLVLFEWDYDGDGVYDWVSETTPDTYFTYMAAGTYSTVVRVTDNDGLSAVASRTITVGDSQVKPIATASATPVEGHAPMTVTFSGTAVDPDEGAVAQYEWDFDGDGVYEFQSTTTASTSHVYTAPGSYLAVFKVTDQDGLTGMDEVVITVKAAGVPTAVANATPTSGDIPLPVSFDASGSSDPDGTIAQYEWTFGGLNIWMTNYSNWQIVQTMGQNLDGYGAPYWIAVDPNNGNVWVTLQGTNKVIKISPDGSEVLLEALGFSTIGGIDVVPSDSSVWVADIGHDQVVKLNSNGTEQLRIGGFNDPQSVTVDPSDDSVWVTDYYYDRVVKLDKDGNIVKTLVGLYRPKYAALDKEDGSLWVADYSNHRIVKFFSNVPDSYDYQRPYRTDTGPNELFASYAGNTASVDGYLNKAVSMDGSGDYLRIPSTPHLDLQDFTVEAWIKDDVANSRCIFMRGNSSGGNELYFGIRDFDSMEAVLDNGDSVLFDGDAVFNDQSFHHVALSYDADAKELKAYLDGVQYGDTQVITATLDFGNSDALIGADFDSFNGSLGNYWDGVLDEVRVWDIARTGEEILGTKDIELTGSEPGLAAYYNMNAHHAALGGFYNPNHVAIHPKDHSVWVADYNNKQVVHVNKDCTGEILRVSGFNQPTNCYLAPGTQNVWVGDATDDIVKVLDYAGKVIKTYPGIDSTCITGYRAEKDYFSSTETGTTTHSYPNKGEYLATLTVTDDDGNVDTDSVTIRAGIALEALPIASPTTGVAPLTVIFASNGYYPSGTIEYFVWDFNGDGVLDTPYSDWRSQRSDSWSYTFSVPGTYTASLTVIDKQGVSDTKSITITVLSPNEDGSPVALAMADPQEGNAPLNVTLNGFGKDLDGFIRKFEWDFTSNGSYDFESTTTGQAAHTYNAVGQYTATLQVTDDTGKTATDTVTIYVKELGAPTAQAQASPTSGNTALEVAFTGAATDDGDILFYEWDFEGDGVYDYSSSTNPNTTHIYTVPGDYDAVLRVTDDDGLQDTDTVNIIATAGLTASLSKDQFDPALGDVFINTVFTAQCKVTIYIKDRVGAVVRTLVNQEVRPAGYYSDAWDGKNDSGQLLKSGVYMYTIEYETGGKRYTYDLTNNVDYNKYPPGVTYPINFSPLNAETNFFRYTLSGKSEVTVYMSPYTDATYAEDRIRTLLLRKPQKGGSYVLVWDGTDDAGNLVDPGMFVIAVFAWHLPDNAIILNNLPVVSDLSVTPTYLNPDGYPYSDQYEAKFGFTLSKTADIAATIYDFNNYIVRTVTRDDVPPGAVSGLKWDGKNSEGHYVPPGVYRIKVIATDDVGNKSEDANTLLIVFY